jgi:hypothetical protein
VCGIQGVLGHLGNILARINILLTSGWLYVIVTPSVISRLLRQNIAFSLSHLTGDSSEHKIMDVNVVEFGTQQTPQSGQLN